MDNIISSLRDFGLTDYEARVYNSLVDQGVSSATEISVQSKVPRARIYDVLSTLARKGWVQIIEGSPTMYVSFDIKEIENKLKKKEEKMRKARETVVDSLKAGSKEDYSFMSHNADDIYIQSADTLNKLSFLIESAQKRIFLFNVRKKWVLKLLPGLKKAAKRRVNVMLIISRKEYDLKTIRKLQKYFEVKKHNNKPDSGCMLVDFTNYLNIFFKENGLQANEIKYRKCIYCLNAWLRREWDSV